MDSEKNSFSNTRSTLDYMYEFDIEDFIVLYDLQAYREQSHKRKADVLKSFKAVEFYRNLELLHREVAALKTENLVLNNFLSRIDPKFIRTDRGGASGQFKRSFITPHTAQGPNTRKSKVVSMRGSKSNTSRLSGQRFDYQLNYLAKGEMTRQSKMYLEKEISQLKKTARNDNIDIRSRITEATCLINDIEHIGEAFRQQFHELSDEKGAPQRSSEKELELKLHSFENTWMKLAQQFLYKIRLETHGTINSSMELQNDIAAKELFRNILCEADFDLMKIKRDGLMDELVQTQSRALSNDKIMSKVAAQLTFDKKQVQASEQQLKSYQGKIAELKYSQTNMQKDIARQEKNYDRDIKKKLQLQNQMLQFSAPSVNDYVILKDLYQHLLKEEKTLRRKLYVSKLGKKY